jgi:hypothetical protein
MMFDAVSTTVIPKLDFSVSPGAARLSERSEPEHIRGFTVTALQYLRCQVQLIAFTLKSRPNGTQGRIRTGRRRQHRAGPQRSHPEIAYFEATLASDENVGWLQIQVDDASIMNEVKTLEQPSQISSRPQGTSRPRRTVT